MAPIRENKPQPELAALLQLRHFATGAYSALTSHCPRGRTAEIQVKFMGCHARSRLIRFGAVLPLRDRGDNGEDRGEGERKKHTGEKPTLWMTLRF